MGLPKPFSRPSINLGGGTKKDWQEVEVRQLNEGDTVQGWGTVDWIEKSDDVVKIVWMNSTRSILKPTDKVTAFTAV